ncbi:MAG: MBL fold metallo-hydrolase [Chloroflexi bacterium CG_4_9_14_3_um_filter_45_9]|nr:MAG: MBL fold metallo-hydrolase [Dehalococcoidia bacterium CG2_30_46_9]PIU23994.1 MAG: MBL fold metallo-hydrolase [Chloroflexi bacterium CG08_land_8_20_14_0_20_45_12]PJB50953.1 MAG: MBL fold metallo-hydrolase [Chloroflexi bacterium CG_4_9_14_3_um_filter_45_9]
MRITRIAAILLIGVSLALVACASPMPTPTNSHLNIHFIDVGQGDSIILRYGSSSMIIDAGTNASTNSLINTIKGMGISKFDIVVGTHPHEDHIGGMDAVINQFDIGTIYMPKVTTTTKTFQDVLIAIKNKGLTITTPETETIFNFGETQCTILAPNSQTYEDLNNYSIIIKLVYGNTSFLLTGDAQTESEKEMLSNGYNLQSDVLKVGHHGSSSSTSPEFLKAVSPQYSIISVGKNNDYGHPHQVTLDKLAGAGVKVYRTDLNGTITIISDGSDLSVSTMR